MVRLNQNFNLVPLLLSQHISRPDFNIRLTYRPFRILFKSMVVEKSVNENLNQILVDIG